MNKCIFTLLATGICLAASIIPVNAADTGWIKHEYWDGVSEYHGAWEYLYDDGSSALGWTNIDGNWYYFDLDSGSAASGLERINDRDYYFDEDTLVMAKNQYVNLGKENNELWYWCNDDGEINLEGNNN